LGSAFEAQKAGDVITFVLSLASHIEQGKSNKTGVAETQQELSLPGELVEHQLAVRI
jgi:hypothetical protein